MARFIVSGFRTLNTMVNENDLEIGDCTILQNVQMEKQGLFSKRPGFCHTDLGAVNAACETMFACKRQGGIRYIFLKHPTQVTAYTDVSLKATDPDRS